MMFNYLNIIFMKKLIKNLILWIDKHPQWSVIIISLACIPIEILFLVNDWRILTYIFALPSIVGAIVVFIFLLVTIISLLEFIWENLVDWAKK